MAPIQQLLRTAQEPDVPPSGRNVQIVTRALLLEPLPPSHGLHRRKDCDGHGATTAMTRALRTLYCAIFTDATGARSNNFRLGILRAGIIVNASQARAVWAARRLVRQPARLGQGGSRAKGGLAR